MVCFNSDLDNSAENIISSQDLEYLINSTSHLREEALREIFSSSVNYNMIYVYQDLDKGFSAVLSPHESTSMKFNITFPDFLIFEDGTRKTISYEELVELP